MDELLNQILDGQAQILKRFDGIDGRLHDIEDKLDENTQMVKALLHRTEELDAKFDDLLNTTTTKDAIIELKSGLDILNTRLFQQETKMQTLENNKVTD